jgi:hypothetical protein
VSRNYPEILFTALGWEINLQGGCFQQPGKTISFVGKPGLRDAPTVYPNPNPQPGEPSLNNIGTIKPGLG